MHLSAKALAVTILLCSIFSPIFSVRVTRRLDVVRDVPTNNFSKVLEYAKNSMVFDRIEVFKAACDSSAFTCAEVIHLASFDVVDWGPRRWADTVILFAEGRNHKGCISDPANAEAIVNYFEKMFAKYWHFQTDALHDHYRDKLRQAFIKDKSVLKPAQVVWSPHVRLQTGVRTDSQMRKLLEDLEQMMPGVLFYWPGSLLEEVFQDWLKQIRGEGEQFSGPQMVTLADAVPLRAVPVLLEYLEQYMTGVTCEEVSIIQRLSTRFIPINPTATQEFRTASLAALKSNILDGYNKVAVVADPMVNRIGVNIAETTQKALRDVDAGLPPKNNPIFGLVKGNPVIIVVDESDSMDVNFTLGKDTFTRRTFCHSQLEVVLKGLSYDTYFNVIQFSSSVVRVFPTPVLANKTSIGAAMNKVDSIWRDNYTMWKDPVQWLRRVRGFSLKFKHQFNGHNTKSMEALRLAYATADLQSQQRAARARVRAHKKVKLGDPGNIRPNSRALGTLLVTKPSAQIYFLTSSQPHGGSGQILEKIEQLDNGRNIPVNSITFSNASAELSTKQFGKALSSKTGGFFRSIEQD